VAVDRGEIIDKALAVGTIEPEVEISVKSQSSGVVRQRFADIGDFVRAGDPLLEIKPNPTPLELADARRQVELQEIQLENLTRDLARQRALLDQGLVSEREFQLVERQQAEVTIQVQMAVERLALLEEGKVTIADDEIETVIRSPIDGFILEKMVDIGDPVVPLSTYQEGTVLMAMAEMSALIFRGTVDEIDVGKLTEGMEVDVKIGALPNAKIVGVLSNISLKARKENNATVFPVEITLRDTGGAVLRAGYSANADIIIDRRMAVLVIPERLVTYDADSTYVTVRRGDGTNEIRLIETGLSDAIDVEVLSGIEEGELVVEAPPREIQ
jgi:HlyD family secretion protein